MRSSTNRKTEILSRLRREFSRFRRYHRGGKGSGYPVGLREQALSGLDQGISPSEVSAAAGVSCESLKNWRKGVPRVHVSDPAFPVELQLVESRESLSTAIPAASSPASLDAIVHIRLPSGAQLSLPVTALSGQLLSHLMGGAP